MIASLFCSSRPMISVFIGLLFLFLLYSPLYVGPHECFTLAKLSYTNTFFVRPSMDRRARFLNAGDGQGRAAVRARGYPLSRLNFEASSVRLPYSYKVRRSRLSPHQMGRVVARGIGPVRQCVPTTPTTDKRLLQIHSEVESNR